MSDPASIVAPAGRLLASLALTASLHGAPTGTNLGFEQNLAGWTAAGVAVVTTKVHAGSKSLALRNGHIEQRFTGLSPGATHHVALAYRDDTPESWLLGHARIRIDGVPIGEIHNGQSSEYLDCGGFEFIAGATSATLRIESLDPGPAGLLIDEIRIVAGALPAPPEHPWNSLSAVNDARGGRQLANGGFESATSDPASDPFNSGPAGNPHLCGNALPGWRVTRENVDLIEASAARPPQGTKALDTGGHGPGAIAQTITGLQAGAAYTFSFRYARHVSWGSGDMRGEVRANGRLVASLTRSIAQTWNAGYDLKEIPVLASPEGKLSFEIRSTTTDQGGNIIYDDVRLKPGGDAFLAWSVFHSVSAHPEANDDQDPLPNGLEFLFGSDPRAATTPPGLRAGLLRVPLSGLALAQGHRHVLLASRDLAAWQSAASPGAGITLVSDSSAPGVDGERVFALDPAEPKLFWRHRSDPP